MANSKHLEILQQGVEVWNQWRKDNPKVIPDLSNAILEGVDLQNANLSKANLKEIDFGETILIQSDLSWANLYQANLRKAILYKAALTGAYLCQANFRKADLQMAELSWVDDRNVDFTETDLDGANLIGKDLSGSDLSGLDLHRRDLRGAILNGANLDGTDLSRANLDGARLVGASLVRTMLDKATLDYANLSDANLTRATLNDTNLTQATLTRASLISATLVLADLKEAKCSEANLTWANLRRARLIGTNLDGATLSGAMLEDAQLAGWSIKGIICECIYWDGEWKDKRVYRPGEFERLYADKTKVRLFYKDGFEPLEFDTLPTLIKLLEGSHPVSGLRMISLKEDSGGVVVELAIENDSYKTHEELLRLKYEIEATAQRAIEHERKFLAEQKQRLHLEGRLEELRLWYREQQLLLSGGNQINVLGNYMGDTYNISGQAGAVGQNANANDMTFNQANNFEQTSDLPALATQLEELQQNFEKLGQERKHKMKLSKDAKDNVEAQFSIYLDTSQKMLDVQLKDAYRDVSFRHQAHESRTQLRIDYIEGLIKTKTGLYIQAYKTDGKIIDETERDEIMEEFESLVQSHSNIGTEYTNVFSGLSPEQAKAFEERLISGYRNALNIAQKELELAMTEMRLKEKERTAKKSRLVEGFTSDPKFPT